MSQAKSEYSYLLGFISMMENLNEPWGIKDLNSRHLYMNRAAYLYTHTPANFNVEGVLDQDFPAEWAEFSDQLQEHDRRTEEARERVTVVETHYWYGKKSLSPYLGEKFPIFDGTGNCIGTIWNAKPLCSFTPLRFINQKKPTVLNTIPDNKNYTKAEMDIIFLMLLRYSAKEIANIYSISVKTVENRIHMIYQKSDVHSLKQFEEYCITHNFDNYIPARLIKKGIYFI